VNNKKYWKWSGQINIFSNSSTAGGPLSPRVAYLLELCTHTGKIFEKFEEKVVFFPKFSDFLLKVGELFTHFEKKMGIFWQKSKKIQNFLTIFPRADEWEKNLSLMQIYITLHIHAVIFTGRILSCSERMCLDINLSV